MKNGFVSTELLAPSHSDEGVGPYDPDVEFHADRTYRACAVCGDARTPVLDYEKPFVLTRVWNDRSRIEWPDILRSCYTEEWAVDEKVALDMECASLKGYRLEKLHVSDSIPKSRRPPKPYWVVIPLGNAVFIKAKNPNAEHKYCPKCGRFMPTPEDKEGQYFRLIDGTWDGSDWISATVDNNWSCVLCSWRVIDCAHRFGWRNACFSVPYSSEYQDVSIDYHAENWRDLFAFDFERQTRKILRLRGMPVTEPPEHPIRPRPIYSPDYVPPQPKHPFDELGEFDGCGWKGHASLRCMAGYGELHLLADPKKTERYWAGEGPPKRFKELFEIVRKTEGTVLPVLVALLRKAFDMKGIALPPEASSGGLEPFSNALKDGAGDLALYEPGNKPFAEADLTFTFASKIPPNQFVVHLAVDRKVKTVSILSSEWQ